MHRKTREMVFRTALGPTPGRMSEDAYKAYEEADQLCYKASEYIYVNKVDEAARLASDAVKVSMYCSDAFNILAGCISENAGESLILHRWAMRVGQVYLGEACFKDERGSFYGLLYTRPYMRACLGVANALIALGCHEEAIVHLQEMIRLDDGDHLGARLLLFVSLLMARRLTEFSKLYKESGDNSGCYGLYGDVYLQDAIGANDKRFTESVRQAMRQNKFVHELLRNPNFEFERIPFGVQWTGPDGAHEYLRLSHFLWQPELKRRLIKTADQLLPEILAEEEAQKRQIQLDIEAFRKDKGGRADWPPA